MMPKLHLTRNESFGLKSGVSMGNKIDTDDYLLLTCGKCLNRTLHRVHALCLLYPSILIMGGGST